MRYMGMGEMKEARKGVDSFKDCFARIAKGVKDSEPVWLRQSRTSAMENFCASGLPTTRQEDWRYTDVAPLGEEEFESSPPAKPARMDGTTLQATGLGGWDASEIVFVNGQYAPEISSLKDLPEGVTVRSLASALKDNPETLRPYLGWGGEYGQSAFVALNEAFLQDGAYIYLPPGVVVPDLIHLVFVATQASKAFMSHPRNLIVAGLGVRAAVAESYVGPDDGNYFTNVFTQIQAGENAVVDHYKIECEGQKAFHVSMLEIRQGRSSRVTSHAVSLGGALVRNDIRATLNGEGAEVVLNGLVMAAGLQHIDNHTLIDHARGHCRSREFYLAILDGASRGVFDGKIMVREGSQKSNARQTSKSLLLSEGALANAKPQLEIYADDVKCNHAASVGQLAQDAIFYLRSRGMTEKAARSMLTYAFANEFVEGIGDVALRRWLEDALSKKLPIGNLTA